MDKIFIVAIILFFPIQKAIKGQEITPPFWSYTINDFTITNENGIEVYRFKENNQKVNGKFTIYFYDNGILQYGISGKDLSFVNGMKSGTWRYQEIEDLNYYVVNYNKGLVIGKYKVYFKYNKPIKKKKGNYSYTDYIRADSLLYETDFVDGNGVWKDFYYQGGIKETGEYKSGKKEGEWLYYTENSFLYKKIYYEGGMPVDSVIIEIPDSLKIEKQMPH